jgi:hypothetical protein
VTEERGQPTALLGSFLVTGRRSDPRRFSLWGILPVPGDAVGGGAPATAPQVIRRETRARPAQKKRDGPSCLPHGAVFVLLGYQDSNLD